MEQEDYLETIFNLNKEKGYVRISDIANDLGISKPSVTQMMQRLKKDGMVDYKPYQPLKLKPKGRSIGKKVAERHRVLTGFFTLLGVPAKIQEQDIHGIEHHLSPATLRQLKKATEFLKRKNYDKR